MGWIRALLPETEACPLKLERLVGPTPPSSRSTSSLYIEFDASIYGGGAILRDSSACVVEYFSILWTDEDAAHVGVAPNDCRHQTFWEFLTLLLALVTWGDQFTEETVLVATIVGGHADVGRVFVRPEDGEVLDHTGGGVTQDCSPPVDASIELDVEGRGRARRGRRGTNQALQLERTGLCLRE